MPSISFFFNKVIAADYQSIPRIYTDSIRVSASASEELMLLGPHPAQTLLAEMTSCPVGIVSAVLSTDSRQDRGRAPQSQVPGSANQPTSLWALVTEHL